MTPKPLCEFLVASCVPEGGAYRCQLNLDHSLTVTQFIPMPSPMFLALRGSSVYAVLRQPFSDSAESGLGCYDLPTGAPKAPLLSTRGEIACHLSLLGDDVYCANYRSGSLIRMPDHLQSHSGSGPHPHRQTASHVHGIFPTPNGRFLLVCDLGLDRVFVYTRDLTLVSEAAVPPGFGPRHLCCSPDGSYVYCLCELSGSLCVFSFSEGSLSYLYSLSLLPSAFSGEGSAAAIRLSMDGTRLYITERATEQLLTLSVDGPKAKLLASTPCGGKEPRDLALLASDRYAACANQYSNLLSLFQITDNGIPQFLKSIPFAAPVCVIPILTT